MEILLLISSVVIGAAIASFSGISQNNMWFKWVLAFSGAYLFGVTISHILPEAFQDGMSHTVAASILGGFLVQYFLDFFSGGIEHGHFHAHGKRLPIGLLLGLFIHSFIEGIPASVDHHHHHQDSILWAIFIHKIPISIVLFILLKQLLASRRSLILILSLFALTGPLGFLLGDTLLFFQDNSKELMGFTAGIFLHVSTTIIFESEEQHTLNIKKMIAVILGFIIAYSSTLF